MNTCIAAISKFDSIGPSRLSRKADYHPCSAFVPTLCYSHFVVVVEFCHCSGLGMVRRSIVRSRHQFRRWPHLLRLLNVIPEVEGALGPACTCECQTSDLECLLNENGAMRYRYSSFAFGHGHESRLGGKADSAIDIHLIERFRI
jgi:hypothetical protein